MIPKRFIAWDKATKKEVELLNSIYELQKMNKTKKELNNLEFFQSIGKKDMHGKELFEEYIIKFKTITFIDRIGIIFFCTDSLQYWINTREFSTCLYHFEDMNNIESLGLKYLPENEQIRKEIEG